MTLDLRSSEVGTLADEAASWPRRILLHGFVYGELHETAPADARTRIDWLRRQPPPFLSQPYEQLAITLRNSGHESDALTITIAQEEDRAKVTRVFSPAWWWYRIFGPPIGYGYKPWYALWWMTAFLVLGTVLFDYAYQSYGLQEMTDRRPVFNSAVYSIDTFVPLIDLNQAEHWLPRGRYLRLYHWIHILLGWVLSTLLAVGLAGTLKE